MAKLDLKALLGERKVKVTLVMIVVTYVIVSQLLYSTFWRHSSSAKRFLLPESPRWLNFWKSDSDSTKSPGPVAVHIHGEDQTLRLDHDGIGGHEHPGGSGRISVAIGGGITSKHLDRSAIEHMYSNLQFFKMFLPSFCQTASPGFDYHFYLAYDMTDALFTDAAFLASFQQTFVDMTLSLCSDLGTVALHLVECSHTGKPAWAQNDAMLEAYLDNVDYHYRINDDTVMKTKDWTRTFVKTLEGLDPPRIGVVGPNHSGGNTAILTYDFVHRTHVDVFGYYYPRLFTDWFADGWITRVYRPDRCLKLSDVHLVHTLGLGQRYKVENGRGNLQPARVTADKAILNRYINYTRTKDAVAMVDGKKVISMSLFGKDPKYTWGAIRNAQLAPIVFPGWKLRIYVPPADSETSRLNWTVPGRVLNKLKQLGAELAYVKTKSIPPFFWRYLVVDDSGVDYFIVRNADSRLSERDAIVVNDWLQRQNSNESLSVDALHCIRDHPNHATMSMVEGLWGARRAVLHDKLNRDMSEVLDTFYSMENKSIDGTAELLQRMVASHRNASSVSILGDILWPLFSADAYCHDSVSCEAWPGARKFPVARRGDEFLGRQFDQNQEPVQMDAELLGKLGSQCMDDAARKPS